MPANPYSPATPLPEERLRVARVPPFCARTDENVKGRKSVDDYTTEPGATRLAERIERVWRAAGYDDVRAEVMRCVIRRDLSSDVRWDVRTNLINGLPPSIAGVPYSPGTGRWPIR